MTPPLRPAPGAAVEATASVLGSPTRKGLTMADAMNQARLAHIENPAAWSGRAYLCGMCTLAYEVRT